MQCTVHGPYCLLWHDRIDNIFAHFIKGRIFEEKILNLKCVFWFSLQLSSETLLFRKRNKWDVFKNVLAFMHNPEYSCQILMKLEFSRQIFEKCWNVTFHENPSSGSQIVSWGRTGRHDEIHNRFSPFCERVWKINGRSEPPTPAVFHFLSPLIFVTYVSLTPSAYQRKSLVLAACVSDVVLNC
jgi:hypothetical protein